MSVFDPRRCAHELQAGWIAPPADTVLAVAGRREAYAGFRHAATNHLLLVKVTEAAKLVNDPAVLIWSAVTLDDNWQLEAVVCYDRRHGRGANCHIVFLPGLQLALPLAS
jgi:hypothetical protein